MTNTTEQKILNALSKSNEPICLSYTKQIKSLGFTRKDFNKGVHALLEKSKLIAEDNDDLFNLKSLYKFKNYYISLEGG